MMISLMLATMITTAPPVSVERVAVNPVKDLRAQSIAKRPKVESTGRVEKAAKRVITTIVKMTTTTQNTTITMDMVRLYTNKFSENMTSRTFTFLLTVRFCLMKADDFLVDDSYVYEPRPTVAIWGEAFSFQTTIPPVYPTPLVPDNRDLGTMFLYTNWTTNVQNVNQYEIKVFVDGEEVILWISIDGYCTRTGLPTATAQAYCHFTYTVYDPVTLLISGSFTSQGFFQDAVFPGEFTITGGSGLLTGASGIVEVAPAVLDTAMNPPLVVSPPADADIFDGVNGYAHYFEIDADLFFFMPDMYYTPGSKGSKKGGR
jgi:hypothetical protein